jgi:hypothetical protein
MFQNSIPGGSVSSWNTANVVNMKNVFNSSLTSLSQSATSWNVSKVTNMEGMFFASGLYNANLSTWSVGKVTNMKNMFAYNGDGSTVNYTIDNWDVSEVTTMERMFDNTRFNGNITRWDTQAVSNMDRMFASNTLFAQDLTGWCVGLISTLPTNFGGNTSWTNKPGWGTCPLSLSIRPQFTLTADVFNVQPFNGNVPLNISSNFTPEMDGVLEVNPTTFMAFRSASGGEVSSRINIRVFSNTSDGLISINWGDGAIETLVVDNNYKDIFHNYSSVNQYYTFSVYDKTADVYHIEVTGLTYNQVVAVMDWGSKNNWSTIRLRDNESLSFVPSVGIPTSVTSAYTMFRSTPLNDVRLKYWNVSNITDMSAMFSQNGATHYFNQDLSKWCVSSISTKPAAFDSSDISGPSTIWTQPQPVWGTCPSMPSINRMPKNVIMGTGSAGAFLTTASSKFGSSSANVSSSSVRISPDNDFAFENRNFTVEMWISPSSLTGLKTYWDNRMTEDDNNKFRIELDGNTLKFIVNNIALISGTYTPSINTWAHIAVSRSGGSTRMFVNGVQIGSTLADTNVYKTGILHIGDKWRSGYSPAGLIDEVRVSKTARYTANFTPATSAFTNDSNTVLLLHFNGTNGTTYTEDDIS